MRSVYLPPRKARAPARAPRTADQAASPMRYRWRGRGWKSRRPVPDPTDTALTADGQDLVVTSWSHPYGYGPPLTDLTTDQYIGSTSAGPALAVAPPTAHWPAVPAAATRSRPSRWAGRASARSRTALRPDARHPGGGPARPGLGAGQQPRPRRGHRRVRRLPCVDGCCPTADRQGVRRRLVAGAAPGRALHIHRLRRHHTGPGPLRHLLPGDARSVRCDDADPDGVR